MRLILDEDSFVLVIIFRNFDRLGRVQVSVLAKPYFDNLIRQFVRRSGLFVRSTGGRGRLQRNGCRLVVCRRRLQRDGCRLVLVFKEARDTCKGSSNCSANSAIRAHNCKLCYVGELSERLNCKSMEIRYTIYTKYVAKVDGDADDDL